MTALTWRSAPPDRPGWWWVKDADVCYPEIVEVFGRCGGELNYRHFRTAKYHTVESADPAFWAGPIEEPGEGEG